MGETSCLAKVRIKSYFAVDDLGADCDPGCVLTLGSKESLYALVQATHITGSSVSE